MDISTRGLANGDIVGARAFEIISIPDVSILGDAGGKGDEFTRETVEAYRRDAENMLAELHQQFRESREKIPASEGSFELVWAARAVENQAFRASIRLFAVCRAIRRSMHELEEALQEMGSTLTASLSAGKYEYSEIGFEELEGLVSRNASEECKAFVRDENIVSLQNQILGECYSFDRIPAGGNDLGKIANALVDAPGVTVTMQLIPTAYTPQEAIAIDRMATALSTLAKGVRDQVAGNVGFALAEKEAGLYRYYSERKTGPLYAFNILVTGPRSGVRAVSSAVFGQLNSAPDGNVAGKFIGFTPSDFDFSEWGATLPWAMEEFLVERERRADIWATQRRQAYAPFWRMARIVTAEEASAFFRLPVGSQNVAAGFNVNKASLDAKTYAKGIVNAGEMEVGRLKSSARGDTIGFSLRDLTKHMLVVGTPGSGKTTFSVSLLDRLWKRHKIPFLVIEPAKNEYRALVESIPDIQIFTPGKNFISPFVFNPFTPPRNVTLESYKSVLKTAFAAAVTMSTPLDKIFEEAVNDCYSDFRWLDTYTSDDKGRVFNIQDFIKSFRKTFDAIGYTGDARNIGRAGVVRLKSLANLFDNYPSIPVEDLLSKPTIIELAAIENAEQKSLIIALLLLSILSYVNRNYIGEGKLRNVILLEEAHVLLDSADKTVEGAADPGAIAKGLVKRMLAEIRSYGVGMVIADQSPRKVGTDVVALTNIKLAFRLVEREDKETIADSTNMSEAQVARLARLRPGEAMLFFDRLEEPEEVKTQDYRAAHGISISLSDESIRDRSTYWNGRENMLRPYPECEYLQACKGRCDFGCRALAKELSRRLYAKRFTLATKDFAALKTAYLHIANDIAKELDGDELTDKLAACTKMQFLRRIKYDTAIPITDAVVKATLTATKTKGKDNG